MRFTTADAEHVRREFAKAAKDVEPKPLADQLTAAEQTLLLAILARPPDERHARLCLAARLPSRQTIARLARGHRGQPYNIAAVRAWLAGLPRPASKPSDGEVNP